MSRESVTHRRGLHHVVVEGGGVTKATAAGKHQLRLKGLDTVACRHDSTLSAVMKDLLGCSCSRTTPRDRIRAAKIRKLVHVF